MIAYLDANILIYYIEQPTYWGPQATVRLAALRAAGDQLTVSDLHRLECLVGPLISADAAMFADFNAFFNDPSVGMLLVSTAMYVRAAYIRACASLQTA